MKTKLLSLSILLAASGLANAHTVSLGESLPSVSVEAGGIIDTNGDFTEWSTDKIEKSGTVAIIASAARPEANEMTPEQLVKDLEGNKSIKLYKIVNSDDAPFGAGMFIEGAVKDGKVATPHVESVLDEDGEFFAEVAAEEASSLFIVLKDGKVTYVHEGPVGATDEKAIREAIR